MADMMTLERLRQLERERAQADQIARDANARRNEAVLMLLDAGMRQAVIAVALDLSPGRVSQIVAAAKRQRERALVAA